jgi:uncharacterized protein YlxP (DUF503 family)
LRIPESGSLKDKRQVVRSLSQRIRNTYQASVAEVGDNDAWQIASLGIAVVGNTHRHCEEVLNSIETFVRDSRLDAELFDMDREIVSFDDP